MAYLATIEGIVAHLREIRAAKSHLLEGSQRYLARLSAAPEPQIVSVSGRDGLPGGRFVGVSA
jgi:hypothetical protein